MVAHQRYFFKTARLFLLGAPLVHAACTSDFGPYPMPTGYTYHGAAYKAPPGPEPVLKKIEHSQDAPQPAVPADPARCEPCLSAMPAVQVAPGPEWAGAAHELVTRMTDRFGVPTEAVYLRPADSFSPTEGVLEQALRVAMTDAGFHIAPGPGAGPYSLQYAATPLSGVVDGSRMMVTISLAGNDGVVAEESGIYTVAAPAMSAVPAMTPPVPVSEPPPPGTPMLISPSR